jgi:uncharacterized protein
MSKKSPVSATTELPPWYRGTDVPMAVIRRFVRKVAERFKPEKIILFGSHAYGEPHADSDVDILVVMPARNEIDRAVRIDRVVDPLFPLDLIVCSPKSVAWRINEGDSFLLEIMTKGKVLYEKAPGKNATKREAASALRWAGKFRTSARTLLNIPPGR